MARRRSRELIAADEFRAKAASLLRVRHADWDDYERRFLSDQINRPEDYRFSDDQWKFLRLLISRSRTYSHYAGNTVPELVQITDSSFLDLDDEEQEKVSKFKRWEAIDLKLRQICFLAKICRRYEPIGRDALLDTALTEFVPDEQAA